MDEVILLGAGASVDAGVPGAFSMTQELIKLFEADYSLARQRRVLQFAIGGLLFQQGVRGQNPFNGINVEELFNAIEILAGRHELEAAPFIASWHPVVSEMDSVGASSRDYKNLQSMLYKTISSDMIKSIDDKSREIDSSIEKFVAEKITRRSTSSKPGKVIQSMIKSMLEGFARRGPSNTSNFAKEFTRLLSSGNQGGSGYIFHETSIQMIRKLVDLVWVEDSSKIEYLKPLILPASSKRQVIATLNYDNTIELTAQELSIPYETGIDAWSSTGTLPSVNSNLYLLKLHGSIDWSLIPGTIDIDRPLDYSVIERVAPADMKTLGFEPSVIFGQRNKLTAKGPYLDLLRAFDEELHKVDHLTVIGYSFRDDHINEFISQWFNGSRVRRVRVINGPNFPGSQDGQFITQMMRNASSRVDVIPEYAESGIRNCYTTVV